ncbi:RloB domain-containing protein [Mesorhizobium japonicum]|uniref:RloB domain-containing protein n=1 Tax=Mesorhizobium japonicum R7A TaxID=935547 RepID=A0ABX6N090_9HYPH|nr:RloB domain-containing protein [Mesorhizobium japonicum]PBB15104.1 hypothetical protein CK231_05495 [Mesorhizobium loti]QGX76173.1 RloB domain-containing protein [Mesorhizobium japonicum R7A]MBE1712508.1 RloB domain-containing protein [Mesorhizobium japonicum]MUT24679.1 hypothetical protein [Mesorhizobium japonicum]
MAQAAKSQQQKAGLSSRRRRDLDSYEERDETWAVFDRDEHPRFQEAVDLCLQVGIGVARSNPCFEVWLILHFEKFERPDDRHRVQKRLEVLCPDYSADKGKKPDFSKFMDAIGKAEHKAEAQLEARKAEGAPFGAPSTTVFELTRKIRQTLEEFSKK